MTHLGQGFPGNETTEVSTAEVLRRARALIEKPENWTQESYAADAQGNGISDPNDGAACRFCSVGAVARVLGIDGSLAEVHHAVKVLNDCTDSGGIIDFNDSRSHAELLAVWDDAIAHAEGGDA